MMRIALLIVGLVGLQACTDNARHVAEEYVAIVNDISYINRLQGYNSGASEAEQLATLEKTKALKSRQGALQAPDFNNQDFVAFLYLINHTFEDIYRQRGQQVPIDIGDEKIDGDRAALTVYVAKKACDFTLANRGEWKIQSIACPSYY